jgi:hypothetical protein
MLNNSLISLSLAIAGLPDCPQRSFERTTATSHLRQLLSDGRHKGRSRGICAHKIGAVGFCFFERPISGP